MIGLLAAALAGTATDATGHALTVGAGDRLVVLGASLVEGAFALGAGPRVVGVDSTTRFPPEASGLPKMGYFRQLSAEGALSVRPDVVLVPADAGPPAVLDQLRAAGPVVVVLPADPTVDGARARLRLLGALLDAEERAEALVAALDAGLASVEPASGAPRVLFVYARSAGAMQVSGRGTAAHAMIALAGGVNAIDAWEGYRPLTAEALLLAQPDVLLFTDAGLLAAGGAAAVLAQPGVAGTPAGAARRVVALDEQLLLAFGPRTADAVQALARAIER